jgi:hypothetical protein
MDELENSSGMRRTQVKLDEMSRKLMQLRAIGLPASPGSAYWLGVYTQSTRPISKGSVSGLPHHITAHSGRRRATGPEIVLQARRKWRPAPLWLS